MSQAMLEKRLQRNEPLARHTTLRIGGPAEFFVRVDSRAELIEAVHWGSVQHFQTFILGNGSNILVGDAGIRGLVIENHADTVEANARRETSSVGREMSSVGREMSNDKGEALRVIAESGALLPGLANRLARQGWSGLEWAIGVPATIGAAVVTNAGAHGGAMRDSIVRAEILDLENTIRWWMREELAFEYRTSFLKQHPNEYVVLSAELELNRDEPSWCIARMSRYTEHRRRTQPTEPSVGSMFKNPTGDYAGRLIEAAGLKGKRVGNVQISQIHANFFVNLGGATAKDVLELVALVKMSVLEKFGVELELEIQVVGDVG